MNEEQLLARLARQMLEIERLNAAYDHCARTLADVVGGKTDPARVLVNLTDRTYMIAAEGQCPPMPATINGLPLCVTAPPKPLSGIKDFDAAVSAAAPPDSEAEVTAA